MRKRAGVISRTRSGVSARSAYRARVSRLRPALGGEPLRWPVRPAKGSTAVARSGSQSLAIANPNFAASIADHSFHLQALRNQGDRGAANSQRLRNGFLCRRDDLAFDAFCRLQKPSAEPCIARMNRVAGLELLGLGKQPIATNRHNARDLFVLLRGAGEYRCRNE